MKHLNLLIRTLTCSWPPSVDNMKRLTLISLFLLVTFICFAQQEDYMPQPRPKNCKFENSCPRNSIFHATEIKFKTLGVNSLNWDHLLVCRSTYLVSFRLGFNYLTFPKIKGIGVPFDLCLMLGGGAVMFEMAAGLNYIYFNKNYSDSLGQFKDNVNYLALYGHVGLRYQKQRSPFVRLSFIPTYSLTGYNEIEQLSKKRFLGMLGLGIGYTF